MKDAIGKLNALLFLLEHSDNPVYMAQLFIAETGGFWFGDVPQPSDGRYAVCMFDVTGFGDGPHEAVKSWMSNAKALIDDNALATK